MVFHRKQRILCLKKGGTCWMVFLYWRLKRGKSNVCSFILTHILNSSNYVTTISGKKQKKNKKNLDVLGRVVNCFWKQSLNNHFWFVFQSFSKTIVLFLVKNYRFWKQPTRFELLENKLQTIVFLKTIRDRFLNDCFLKNYR